ncbi:MAG TPA: lysophospholipid acyltransferase family protein [Pseudolabrys sp.]|nr:lysophospholipid acyltransferase family protein [Pseudolabrys sp.]
MPSSREIASSRAVQQTVGTVGAWYLRFVWATSTQVLEPADIYERVQTPAIIAMWHGQHFLMPFIKKANAEHRAKVLISRHRDGEVNAIAAEKLGIGTIRGSGAHNGEFHRKGGVSAFTEMLDALKDGYNVAMTADVPKISRIAGMGVIKLAQHSQRPIYGVAIASSRRKELNNWDRTAINLPFSRIALVASEAITVDANADAAMLEAKRLEVQNELNRLTRRAYEIADKGSRAP